MKYFVVCLIIIGFSIFFIPFAEQPSFGRGEWRNEFRLTDPVGNTISSIKVGQESAISINLGNTEKTVQSFEWILEIIKTDDKSIVLSESGFGKIEPGERYTASIPWVPTVATNHEITLTAWDGLGNKLSKYSITSTIDVKDDQSPKNFQLFDRRTTGLMEYKIPYDLPSGKIIDVNVICDGSEVYLLLDNSEETKLTITIPKKMIKPIHFYENAYFISVNNHETEFEVIDHNPENLILQFEILFVNAEIQIFFDSSARTDNWKKENCQYDRLLVMEKPPKLQIREGIPIERITCYDDLQLIFKNTDNSPACVKPSTAEKLIERGWTKIG